jgi:hypothetical protein
VTQAEQAADAADTVFMRLQGCLAALERLGCVANTLFVGPGLLTRPYAPDAGGHNSVWSPRRHYEFLVASASSGSIASGRA